MEDRRPGAPTDVVPYTRHQDVSFEPGVLPDPGPRPPVIERPQLLVVGAVLLVLLLMVVALATLWPDPPDTTGGADRRAVDVARADGDQSLSDLERVNAEQARRLLRGSGVTVKGEIRSGWTWTDRNGFNLATESITTRGPAGEPASATLAISHVANLDGRPRQLRLLRDPVSCEHRGRLRAGFTPGSFRVSDLNGDGIAEVTAGWWFNCDESLPDGTAIKLLLLSDGEKFIRRGTGPGPGPDTGAGTGSGSDDERVIATMESFRSEPRESRWPREFWNQTQDLLTSLHSIRN